jgi:hypothetical protein
LVVKSLKEDFVTQIKDLVVKTGSFYDQRKYFTGRYLLFAI